MSRMIFAFVLCSSAALLAVEKSNGPDVPETAQLEVQRRGDQVEQLGTIQAGPGAIRAATLAPPEDDSDRWFVTVVTTTDKRFAANCDKLLTDVNAGLFKAWILPDDPSKSWAHYHVRRLEDPTQSDWMVGVKKLLQGQDYPAIVIQPPKNGTFGKNTTVVGIVHGYDGKAPQLAERIRDLIKTYADTIAQKQAVHAIGAPAPFDVPPTALDPLQPRNPVLWPKDLAMDPPGGKPLTYSEVKKLIPKAPSSFVRELVMQKVSSADEVLEAYDEWFEGAKPDTQNPTKWSSSWDVLLPIVVAACLLGQAYLFHLRRKSNQVETIPHVETPVDAPPIAEKRGRGTPR